MTIRIEKETDARTRSHRDAKRLSHIAAGTTTGGRSPQIHKVFRRADFQHGRSECAVRM